MSADLNQKELCKQQTFSLRVKKQTSPSIELVKIKKFNTLMKNKSLIQTIFDRQNFIQDIQQARNHLVFQNQPSKLTKFQIKNALKKINQLDDQDFIEYQMIVDKQQPYFQTCLKVGKSFNQIFMGRQKWIIEDYLNLQPKNKLECFYTKFFFNVSAYTDLDVDQIKNLLSLIKQQEIQNINQLQKGRNFIYCLKAAQKFNYFQRNNKPKIAFYYVNNKNMSKDRFRQINDPIKQVLRYWFHKFGAILHVIGFQSQKMANIDKILEEIKLTKNNTIHQMQQVIQKLKNNLQFSEFLCNQFKRLCELQKQTVQNKQNKQNQ